jgi:hypothetical protein
MTESLDHVVSTGKLRLVQKTVETVQRLPLKPSRLERVSIILQLAVVTVTSSIRGVPQTASKTIVCRQTLVFVTHFALEGEK